MPTVSLFVQGLGVDASSAEGDPLSRRLWQGARPFEDSAEAAMGARQRVLEALLAELERCVARRVQVTVRARHDAGCVSTQILHHLALIRVC